MHKLAVVYPAGDGITFDMAYYRTKHRDICFESLDGMERMDIEEGLPGQPYLAIGHLYFPSLEALQAAMGGPKVGDTAADIPNFTNASPVIQVSEVVA
jgi:uncharacterized protein (TIGR02118 family)